MKKNRIITTFMSMYCLILTGSLLSQSANAESTKARLKRAGMEDEKTKETTLKSTSEYKGYYKNTSTESKYDSRTVKSTPETNNENSSPQGVNQNSQNQKIEIIKQKAAKNLDDYRNNYELSDSQKKNLEKEVDQRVTELENIAQQESPRTMKDAKQHIDQISDQIDLATEGKTMAELSEMSDMLDKKRQEMKEEQQKRLKEMEREAFKAFQENNKK